VNKEIYIDILRRLGMWSEGNATKNGEPTLGLPTRQCSSTPVGFGQGFLIVEQWDNAGTSPYFLSWLQLIFISSYEWNQHYMDGAFVMLLTSLRILRSSWKDFHKKWLLKTFATHLLSLVKLCICTGGPFRSKCSLNYCTVQCFT